MSHRASQRFRECYEGPSPDVRRLADRCYALLKVDPQHPSLRLKRVGRFWSVRVGRRHGALGVDAPGGILWFWIGDHEEYERLIAG